MQDGPHSFSFKGKHDYAYSLIFSIEKLLSLVCIKVLQVCDWPSPFFFVIFILNYSLIILSRFNKVLLGFFFIIYYAF